MSKCYPIFSEEDADIAAYSWRTNKSGYARRTINRKPMQPLTILAHHDVCIRAFGRRPNWAEREVCDHINRNILDNRRENLRITSLSINAVNCAYVDQSTYITRHKQCGFQVQYRKRYVGVFKTLAAAQRVVDAIQYASGINQSMKAAA